MIVQLCPNIEMSANAQVAAEVSKNLTHQGVRCICADSLRAFCADPSDIEWIPQTLADENCDYFAAIGGDGTTLRTAQRAIQQDKPIFSINTGRVGFLAAFDAKFPEEINVQEIKGLKQHKRLLLDFYLKRAPDMHYYAINDVVVQRSTAASTIEIGLQYGNNGVARIRSDGIIVATPTGSTAYSLSAGGPIVAPGVEAFIVTPICAHNLASRSYVLGTDNPVQISLTERADNNACITFDGVTVSEFHRDDTVVIQCGKKYLQLLTSPKRSFYGILSREISEKD